jgi:hypothetical protein
VINTREFLDDLRNNIKASLESAGYHATFQPSTQAWSGSFQVSNSNSQGGVTLLYSNICEHCGESLAYRVNNSQGAFGGRATIPRDCTAATAAECLLPEILPLLTNRLPAAKRHDRGVGAGLLSARESSKLAEAIEHHAAPH